MTTTELAAYVRYKTKTNSTTFSDADMLVLANLFKDEIAGKIQKLRPENFNVPALDDLVADQREYSFPSDVLNNIATLELKFSSSGDYVLANPLQRKDFGQALQESIIIGNYDNEKPFYFIRRRALYILSGAIIAVTNCIRLVYNSFPANLTSMAGSTDMSVDPSTTTHGFPREFHELLGRRVSIGYKNRNNVKLDRDELKYDVDLEDMLENFSQVNLDEQVIGNMPTAAQRGDDDGYNL